MKRYIVALDEGTTSARAVVFDTKLRAITSIANQEFTQIYPQTGWVEHDPLEIWKAQLTSLQQAVAYAGIEPEEIYGIGITNQRETVVMWDRKTGKPVANAIVWQCRRTAEACEKLKKEGLVDFIRERTGLVVDAYFSATKIAWLLEHYPETQDLIKEGRLCVGTIDTFLIWNLTKGESFVTDATNASRTMLFNIFTGDWDDELLELFHIPREILPRVVSSSEIVGYTRLLGASVPVCGIAGDQQAALFGQACFRKGSAKNTYGTGCFILMNVGDEPVLSENNLITTVAWKIGDKMTYALEGSIFNAGSTIQWARDEMKLIKNAAESEKFATKVSGTDGVYVVPAFTGMGAPYWNMEARGTIVGITRGTNRYHVVRACLEAMAYSTRDILLEMQKDCGFTLAQLKCDGGASNNNFLMQFQSDILDCEINRPCITETTALGAVYLAGLASGAYNSLDEIAESWSCDRVFLPSMEEDVREKLYAGWRKAVSRSLDWAEE